MLRSSAIAIMLPLFIPGVLSPQLVRCAPTNDSLRTPDSARISDGVYSLVFVATEAPRHAHREAARSLCAQQALLIVLGGLDKVRRVQNAAQQSRSGAGSAGDLERVGAPLPERGDSTVPRPDSDDPIFPGVVVLVQNWQDPSRLRQNMLWISTGHNYRAERNWMMADGPGIVLGVRVLTPDGFSGTWGPAGLARVGGYFCARRNG
jgi:hypothetical protein